MTTLLLIRHGESEANRNGFFAGQTDVALLKKGIEQARKTAEYIAENYAVNRVYASDLKRAFKTGQVIAELLQADLIPNEKLREINAGEWQGKKFDELVKNYQKDYACWLSNIGNCTCTGGESVRQLATRVRKTLTDIAEENNGKTVVVATHATPIRAMQCMLTGLSLDNMKDIPWVSNASVTELAYENGKWEFISIGEDRHLLKLQTSFPANV